MLIDAFLVPYACHVLRYVGHPGVLDDQPIVMRQRVVRMPYPVSAAVENQQRLFIEEWNTVTVEQSANLCLELLSNAVDGG